MMRAQSVFEARENQGFIPESAGSEVQKGSLAQRAEPSASASRAPQLLKQERPRGVGSCGFSLSWR
eukprot:8995531-Alexandrium_andersonii.AAC.1